MLSGAVVDVFGLENPSKLKLIPLDAAAVAVVTNAVLAAWVVFVPAVAVGTVGTPVSAGLASGAFAARSLTNPVTSASA